MKQIGRIPVDSNSKVGEIKKEEVSFLKRKSYISFDSGDYPPFYNPLSKKFYTQKIIYRDDCENLVIQLDLILMWVMLLGIAIWALL